MGLQKWQGYNIEELIQLDKSNDERHAKWPLSMWTTLQIVQCQGHNV